MSITSAELKKYGSANMPEDDASTSGGAIATTTALADMPQASATIPKVVSSAAGDTTQTVTITGRLASGVIDTDVVTLNGTTQVAFAKTFMANGILKVVLSGAATGTVTLYLNDGTTVIVAIAPGVTTNRRLFYNSASDPSSQKIRYEKEYWKNENATLTLQSAKLKLTADPSSKIRAGLENGTSQSTTNRLTAPSTVTFVDDNVDIDVTSLAAGASIGLWIEQTLAAGAAAFRSTYSTQLAGTTT